MKSHLYLILFLCLLYPSSGEAQTLTYNWLNTDMGLPSNIVYNTYRDLEGYIWFATKNGACRWDSKNFEYFTIADGLPNNEVYQIYADSKNRIWFSTFNRTLSYLFKGKIHNANNDSTLRELRIYPGSPMIELDKKLFFCASDRQVSSYDLYNHHIKSYNELIRGQHYLIENNHKVWFIEITSRYKSTVYSTDTSFLKESLIHSNPSNGDTLTSISYKSKTYSFQKGFENAFYKTPFKGENLMYAYYNDGNVLEAYSDKLFFKEKNHLIVAKDPKSTFFYNKILFSPISEGVVMCRQIPILEFLPDKDLSNNFTFLIKTKFGIYGLNNSFQFIDIKAQKIANQKNDKVIIFYNLIKIKGLYYLVASKDIYTFKQPFDNINKLNNLGIKPNYKYITSGKTPGSYLFSNGGNGGLYEMDAKTYKIKALTPHTKLSIYSVFVDHSHRIWFSTLDKVYVSDSFKNDGTLSYHEFILDKNIPLFCSHFVEDSFGNIFFVTNGGIFVCNGKYVYRLNKTNLLTDNECNKIIIDSAKNSFWVATKKGLSQIKYLPQNDKLHFEVVNRFYKTDGLFSNVINDILLDSNKLYIATDKGVNVLDNLSYRPPSQKIPVYMNLEAINGRSLTKNDKPDVSQLKHNENNLTVHFSALYYLRRDRLKVKAYLYRNDELISRNEITEDRINYYSLNDGKYKLVLYAFDQDYHYIHGQSAPFVFTIYPPYYKTWWFIGGLSLTIIIISTSILLWSLSRRRARELKQAELNAKLNESTLKSLQSQMNPHFVFNSLNTIQHFITSKKEADALDYLSDFSRLMRNMLEQSVLTLISLENEISFLHQYIQLEKTRFVNSFELTWDVQLSEDDIVDIYIPTMLIQPILENAVKHGISNLMDKKGKIEVTFSLQNENLLLVTIKDNGKTFYHKSKKGNSIALQTIKDRLNIYTKNNNKGEYNLLITEEGATATITIPV